MREILFKRVLKNKRTQEIMTHEWGIMPDGAFISPIIYSVNVFEFVGDFQYTGLTDKNGAKIFEGDFVVQENQIFPPENCAIVTYSSASFMIDVGGLLWQPLNWEELTIIGNIHDNPELLNETE